MRRLVLRFGWVRSTAAALTAAGVAVVFVVLIVPTAFGSSKSAKGGSCKIRFKSFTTDKAFTTDDSGERSAVAIFGSQLDLVDEVQFRGPGKNEWISGSQSFIDEGGGYLVATPEPESVGVKGRIRLVDNGPNPDCYALSPSQFTPTSTPDE
jgi:hypothetical protein